MVAAAPRASAAVLLTLDQPESASGGCPVGTDSRSRNAAGRVQYFCLPDDRVVSFGSQIEV